VPRREIRIQLQAVAVVANRFAVTEPLRFGKPQSMALYPHQMKRVASLMALFVELAVLGYVSMVNY